MMLYFSVSLLSSSSFLCQSPLIAVCTWYRPLPYQLKNSLAYVRLLHRLRPFSPFSVQLVVMRVFDKWNNTLSCLGLDRVSTESNAGDIFGPVAQIINFSA